MKNLILLIVIFILSISGQAQEAIAIATQNDLDSPQIEVKQLSSSQLVSAETKLKHTQKAQIQLSKFLANDIQYPQAIESSGLEGQIIVDVWINKKGKIFNTKIIESFNNSLNNVVSDSLLNFEMEWPKETSYLGARRLRVPIDFTLE